MRGKYAEHVDQTKNESWPLPVTKFTPTGKMTYTETQTQSDRHECRQADLTGNE